MGCRCHSWTPQPAILWSRESSAPRGLVKCETFLSRSSCEGPGCLATIVCSKISRVNKPTASDLARFLVYSLLSSYGIVLGCLLIEMILGLIFGRAFRPLGRFLDLATFAPTFALPIFCGVLFGYRFGSRFSRVLSWLIPLLPSLAAAWELSLWIRSPYYAGDRLWMHIRDNFLTTNCGDTECLAQVVTTAPLLASLASSVGSEIRRLMPSKKSSSAQ